MSTVEPCDMCGHPSHGNTECDVETGYDHLNGFHECGCPGSLATQLADAWDEGYFAGEDMAHKWGHVDHWENPPVNPYRMGSA